MADQPADELPDLGPMPEPELQPWERMLAAGHRLSTAAAELIPQTTTARLLCNIAVQLADSAEYHRDHAQPEHTCGLEKFADALLGREVHRG